LTIDFYVSYNIIFYKTKTINENKMNKKILALSFLSISISISSANAETIEKKLFLFKDLSSYQEKMKTTIKDSKIIEMPNTTVLGSVNYQLTENGKRVYLDNAKIIPKSEKNIFIINEGKKVIINDELTNLVSYGPDFIKTKENEKSFVKYTPKEKIKSISFEKDIDSKSHILQITPSRVVDDAELSISYSIGELNWNPKYTINMTESEIIMDYIIEIDNKTNKNFKGVNLAISTDSIQRIHKDYTNGIDDYMFTVFNKTNNPKPLQNHSYNERARGVVMMDTKSANTSSVVSTMGKESIVFDQKINIDSNSKSLIEYDVNNKFNYNKNNKTKLNINKKEILYNPVAFIELLRKDDEDSMKLVPGVISVYSDKDIYKGQLINELNIGRTNRNQNITFNIGENNDITISSFLEEEKIYDIFTETPTNSIKNEYSVFNNPIAVKKVKLNIKSSKVREGENLEINNGYNSYFISEKHLVKFSEELIILNKESVISNFSQKKLSVKMSNLRKKFELKRLIFNDYQLKEEINESVYSVSVNRFYVEKLIK
jgi:hypothetical protein